MAEVSLEVSKEKKNSTQLKASLKDLHREMNRLRLENKDLVEKDEWFR